MSRLALVLIGLVSSALAFTSEASADDLRIVLHYDHGTVKLVRAERIPEAPRRFAREAEGWRVLVRGENGALLDERRIGDPRRLHVEWLRGGAGSELVGGEALLESARFAIELPVPPESAKQLEVFDAGGTLLATLRLPVEIPARRVPDAPPTGTDACPGWSTALVRDAGDPANRLNITFVGDGYRTDELGSYALDVENTIDYLLSKEPYREYAGFVNFHRVDVISNESGADEPDNGIYKDTALDCSFNWGGTPRCLYCPGTPVYDAADCVPETDEILVVVNTTRYGGCGGGYSVYAGKNASATDIALHELGHSFASLADEYSGGGVWTGGEYYRPNCSIRDEATMQADEAKWWYWLDLPEVGTLQSCGGYGTGLNRPVHDCEMRSLHREFCPVCREEHILDFHRRVDPIDAALPASDPTILQEESAEFSITRVSPATHEHDVQWFLNDAPVAGATTDSFAVAGDSVALGSHAVRVEVEDPTPDVRHDPGGVTDSNRSWTLEVTCTGEPASYDTDGDGICEIGLGGSDCNDESGDAWATPGEARTLSFDADGETLRWLSPQEPGGVEASLVYDVLRADDARGFDAPHCVETASPGLSARDAERPLAGSAFHYLVRAQNDCPTPGTTGTASDGSTRSAGSCP